MDSDLKDFYEKIERIKLDEEFRMKDINFQKEDTKINFSENEKDLKEKALNFEKDGEIIRTQNFEEDAKEGEQIVNLILEDLNKNIFINVKEEEEDKNQMACREILEILRYPHSHKNIRGVVSPFKPLFQPKKVSMVGKVFYNNSSADNNDDNKTRDNTTLNGHNDGK